MTFSVNESCVLLTPVNDLGSVPNSILNNLIALEIFSCKGPITWQNNSAWSYGCGFVAITYPDAFEVGKTKSR